MSISSSILVGVVNVLVTVRISLFSIHVNLYAYIMGLPIMHCISSRSEASHFFN